jgi:hypothetical protein
VDFNGKIGYIMVPKYIPMEGFQFKCFETSKNTNNRNNDVGERGVEIATGFIFTYLEQYRQC